jgi:hypothetical protein
MSKVLVTRDTAAMKCRGIVEQTTVAGHDARRPQPDQLDLLPAPTGVQADV